MKKEGEKDIKTEEISSSFEVELFKLINNYMNLGLNKKDLVHKMEYVIKSCELS